MRDPALLQVLERIHRLLARSFVRYVGEVAHPYVKGDDSWERLALTAFENWHSDTVASIALLEEVLAEEKVHPALPAWPMEFSQYHMVNPTHLLAPALRRGAHLLEAIEEARRGLSGWPEEEAMVARIAEKERYHLARVRGLEVERPRDPPRPGVKKGVSANFW